MLLKEKIGGNLYDVTIGNYYREEFKANEKEHF